MLEILHFIFSSFWVWLGTVILVGAVGTSMFSALMGLITGVRIALR